MNFKQIKKILDSLNNSNGNNGRKEIKEVQNEILELIEALNHNGEYNRIEQIYKNLDLFLLTKEEDLKKFIEERRKNIEEDLIKLEVLTKKFIQEVETKHSDIKGKLIEILIFLDRIKEEINTIKAQRDLFFKLTLIFSAFSFLMLGFFIGFFVKGKISLQPEMEKVYAITPKKEKKSQKGLKKNENNIYLLK